MASTATVVIMGNPDSTRTIRFEIYPNKAIISSEVNKRQIKAETDVELAREFCGGLIDTGWGNITAEESP
jgi:hypothetical protein